MNFIRRLIVRKFYNLAVKHERMNLYFFLQLYVLLVGVCLCLSIRSLSDTKPKLRQFKTLASSPKGSNLRVLQFNILADGLSGLRSDLGAFSRATAQSMSWDMRKYQLLHEILQYKPDCITLQECDHFYDFFLAKLSMYGYDGIYAPKPASACLEVSDNSDGCAIFLKRNKLKLVSAETITYALSKKDVDDGNSDVVRAMNQVGLIVTCDILDENGHVKVVEDSGTRCPLVVCTTHLKAKKSEIGERYRLQEATQLMRSIDRTIKSLRTSAQPLLVVTGDLNAAPNADTTGYEARAYRVVKEHALGLRSLLNDDVRLQESDTWTTWKARWNKGVEKIAKNCIDYILYQPPSSTNNFGLQPMAVLELLREEDLGSDLLPNTKYPSDHVALAADFAMTTFRE